MKYVLALSIVLFSCKSTFKLDKTGFFTIEKKRQGIYCFQLNTDSTFTYSFEAGLYKSCTGNWQAIQKNKLYIECQKDTNLFHRLSSSYLHPLSDTIILLTNKKIIFREHIYKRRDRCPITYTTD